MRTLRKRTKIITPLAAILALLPLRASADAVSDWGQTAQTVMIADSLRFPFQTRVLAIVHGAIFDAVNAIDHRYAPYAVDLSAPGADGRAATAAAARAVLVALVPSQQPLIDATYLAALAAIPNGQAKNDGVTVGQLAAAAILAQRANDGSSLSVPFVPGNGPGAWIPTPPAFAPAVFFAWGNVLPFVINSSTQFLPEGPPALTSSDYTADFDEIKALGRFNSAVRTTDQTNAANFWLENSNFTWNAIARAAVAAKGLGLSDSARLFALLNMAGADAITSGFKAKYIYAFWRPVTAIQNAGTDGNNATTADSSWLPLAVTPAHPDYPSNHSVYSGAAAQVLELLLGNDFAFTASSSTSPFARSFSSFLGAAEECGTARIWVGYHFRTAVHHGLNMGKQIGHFAVNHNLEQRRVRDH